MEHNCSLKVPLIDSLTYTLVEAARESTPGTKPVNKLNYTNKEIQKLINEKRKIRRFKYSKELIK